MVPADCLIVISHALLYGLEQDGMKFFSARGHISGIAALCGCEAASLAFSIAGK